MGFWRMVVGLLAVPLCLPATALDTSEISKRNLPAMVVTMGARAEDGVTSQGSGCVVSLEGLVLVTAHQVSGLDRITVRLGDGRETSAVVIDSRPELDLALLRTDAALPAAVTMGRASTLVMGSPLLAIASPRGLEFSAVRGIVSSMQREFQGRPLIQTDIPAAEGSSGGAVFDGNGALVGLIVARFRDVQGANFVQPIETAFPMLAEHGVVLPALGQGSEGPEEWIPAPGIAQTDLDAVRAYNAGVTAKDAPSKVDHYARAVELLPEFYEAWFNLGVSRTALADVPGAIDAYERGRALDSASVPVHRNLGRLYLKRGETEKAVASFEAAIRLEPRRPNHYNDLGEAYRQARKPAEAIRYYKEALGLQPNYAAAHFNLGLVYAAQDEAGDAVKHFEAYLEAAPGARDAGQVRAWLEDLQSEAAKGKTP